MAPKYQARDNIIYVRFGRDSVRPVDPPVSSRRSPGSGAVKDWLAGFLGQYLDGQKYQRAVTDFRAHKIISWEHDRLYASFLLQGSQLDPFEITIDFMAQSRLIASHWQCTCPDVSVMCRHVGTALMFFYERLSADPDLEESIRGYDVPKDVEHVSSADFYCGAVLPPIPEVSQQDSLAASDARVWGRVLKSFSETAVESLVFKNEYESIFQALKDMRSIQDKATQDEVKEERKDEWDG